MDVRLIVRRRTSRTLHRFKRRQEVRFLFHGEAAEYVVKTDLSCRWRTGPARHMKIGFRNTKCPFLRRGKECAKSIDNGRLTDVVGTDEHIEAGPEAER